MRSDKQPNSKDVQFSFRVAHISMQKSSGHNLISVEEFFAIPLNERVRLIRERKIQFLDEEGAPILTSTALRWLTEVHMVK